MLMSLVNQKIIDISLHYHGESEKAIKVSENGDVEKAFWLPKSQIEYEEKNGTAEVTLPVWLAKEKGII
jgi:hypothetical protein